MSLAVLTLLSDAGRPVLCLVDDVQWMDGPSAGVLGFVVRRLREEPIVVLAAARPDPGRADSFGRTGPDLAQAGLPELILGGLDPGEAHALLTERCGGPLPAPVQNSLLAAATDQPMQQARTALLYGEQLRRHRITSRAELVLLADQLTGS